MLGVTCCDKIQKNYDGKAYSVTSSFYLSDGGEADHPHVKVTNAGLVFSEDKPLNPSWKVQYVVPVGAKIVVVNRIDYYQAMVGDWILLECEYPAEGIRFYYATQREADLKRLPWK